MISTAAILASMGFSSRAKCSQYLTEKSVSPKIYGSFSLGGISVSHDMGATWVTIANFGPEIEVCNIKKKRDGFASAEIRYRHTSFLIHTHDDKSWRAI